jgi:protein SCO1/2
MWTSTTAYRGARRLALLLAFGLALTVLDGCDDSPSWHAMDVSNSSPPLDFTMVRASDGQKVTAADYRGQIVMLYFGYTFCPDVCPLTLSNIAHVLDRLGADARHIRVLFVTVDPTRDTLPVLAEYVGHFGPQVEGLRGTPDQLAALARRYRIAYSVTPGDDGQSTEVTHSSAVYVFDGSGAARLLLTSLATADPDLDGAAGDLRHLDEETHPPSLITRVLRLF